MSEKRNVEWEYNRKDKIKERQNNGKTVLTEKETKTTNHKSQMSHGINTWIAHKCSEKENQILKEKEIYQEIEIYRRQ